MSNSTMRWQQVDHLINDNLTELQADNIAVSIGYDKTAHAIFLWPDDGKYAVCRAVPVDAVSLDSGEMLDYLAADIIGRYGTDNALAMEFASYAMQMMAIQDILRQQRPSAEGQ